MYSNHSLVSHLHLACTGDLFVAKLAFGAFVSPVLFLLLHTPAFLRLQAAITRRCGVAAKDVTDPDAEQQAKGSDHAAGSDRVEGRAEVRLKHMHGSDDAPQTQLKRKEDENGTDQKQGNGDGSDGQGDVELHTEAASVVTLMDDALVLGPLVPLVLPLVFLASAGHLAVFHLLSTQYSLQTKNDTLPETSYLYVSLLLGSALSVWFWADNPAVHGSVLVYVGVPLGIVLGLCCSVVCERRYRKDGSDTTPPPPPSRPSNGTAGNNEAKAQPEGPQAVAVTLSPLATVCLHRHTSEPHPRDDIVLAVVSL